MILVQIVVLGLALAGVIAACRWIYARSPLFGVIVACGLALRLLSGGAMFALSYWESPFLAEAHSGGGFWELAPDARVYYTLASTAADRGISSIPPGSPSPFYVTVLGLWLAASGTSVLNAVLFNALSYVVACLVIVAGIAPVQANSTPGRNAPLLLALVSVTLSPILLMTSTQVLKDPLFALLIVVAFVGVLRLLDLLPQLPSRVGNLLAWTGALLIAQYGIAGIRTYYAVFVLMAFTAAAASLLWRAPAGGRLRAAVAAGSMVCLLWAALIAGAGPYLLRTTRTSSGMPPV